MAPAVAVAGLARSVIAARDRADLALAEAVVAADVVPEVADLAPARAARALAVARVLPPAKAGPASPGIPRRAAPVDLAAMTVPAGAATGAISARNR